MKSTKMENVKRALAEYKAKRSLALKIGCSEGSLYKIVSGVIAQPRSWLIDSICSELQLDPVTGLPMTRQQERAMHKRAAQAFRDNNLSPDSPAEILAHMVRTAMRTELHPAAIDAIKSIAASDELKAIEALARAGLSRPKKGAAK